MASILYKGKQGDSSIVITSQPSLLAESIPIAISTQKVVSNYTGSCLTVRRSSDNATSNIGFSGGIVNTSALLSFVGAGDGFVTEIFDQGGSATITQTISTHQPKIVSSGSVVTIGELPALLFEGNQFLNVSSVTMPLHYLVDINFMPTSTITASTPGQVLIRSGGTYPLGGINLGSVSGSITNETLTHYSVVVDPSFVLIATYITASLAGAQHIELIMNHSTNTRLINRNNSFTTVAQFNTLSTTNRMPDIQFIGGLNTGAYFLGKIATLYVVGLSG